MQVHTFMNEDSGSIVFRDLAWDHVDENIQVQDLTKVCLYKYQAFCWALEIAELNKT